MSRIAKNPIPVPKGVEVKISPSEISIKGPLGTVARPMDPNVGIEKDGESLKLKALGNSNHANAMSGTMRALVANMVTGVTKGFEKKLSLVGVGYRAVVSGIDKQMVGRIAAEIRDVKSPEPYKGKGVRYTGEAIVLKETKKK